MWSYSIAACIMMAFVRTLIKTKTIDFATPFCGSGLLLSTHLWLLAICAFLIFANSTYMSFAQENRITELCFIKHTFNAHG